MKRKIIITFSILAISALLLVGCTANAEAKNSSGNQNGKASAQVERDQSQQADCTTGNGNESTSKQYGKNNEQGECDQSQQSDCTSCNGIESNSENQTTHERNGNRAQRSSESTTLPSVQPGKADASGYGSAVALSDSDLNLGEMLTYALQDEYLAHAGYVYIIGEYGNETPFSNIIKAEEEHISQLLPLFSEYSISAPTDDGSSHVAAVGSLEEAYKAGEQAEINNIAMYDVFLKQELPDDVRTVFEELQKASENHLAAFRNHL